MAATIHSQVFTKAHVIARSLRDNKGFEYRAAFSIALRKVWAEYRTGAIMVAAPSKATAKPRFEVKLAKARQQKLEVAEAFLRKELDLPSDLYPVTFLRASCFSGGTLGHFVHGSNEIELKNSKCLRKTVETLAHELVHAQQVHQKRLAAPETRVRMWEGERMSLKAIEYRRRPWEQEAFKRQVELADKFFNTEI